MRPLLRRDCVTADRFSTTHMGKMCATHGAGRASQHTRLGMQTVQQLPAFSSEPRFPPARKEQQPGIRARRRGLNAYSPQQRHDPPGNSIR